MGWHEGKYDELIDKKICWPYWELSKNRDELTLFLEGKKKAVFWTSGDCCSQTWIESADLPDNLQGTVVKVEDIEMPNLGSISTLNHPRPDRVAYYGLKITTDKGSCVIDYRNDSNGYYGGSINLRLEEVK